MNNTQILITPLVEFPIVTKDCLEKDQQYATYLKDFVRSFQKITLDRKKIFKKEEMEELQKQTINKKKSKTRDDWQITSHRLIDDEFVFQTLQNTIKTKAKEKGFDGSDQELDYLSMLMMKIYFQGYFFNFLASNPGSFSIRNNERDDRYEFDVKNRCIKMSMKLYYMKDLPLEDQLSHDSNINWKDRQIDLEYTFFGNGKYSLRIKNENKQYEAQAEQCFKALISKDICLQGISDKNIQNELKNNFEKDAYLYMPQCDYAQCKELSQIETVLHMLDKLNLTSVARAIEKHAKVNGNDNNQDIYKNLSPESKEIIKKIQEKLTARENASAMRLIID